MVVEVSNDLTGIMKVLRLEIIYKLVWDKRSSADATLPICEKVTSPTIRIPPI
jgi:hypothetical protein